MAPTRSRLSHRGPSANESARRCDRITVEELIKAIRRLPFDEPREDPQVWYRTQKEHWLGWLGDYGGPGAYDRKTGGQHDARFAYNHIVCAPMLLWLAEASGVAPDLVSAATADCSQAPTLNRQSGIIRRHIP